MKTTLDQEAEKYREEFRDFCQRVEVAYEQHKQQWEQGVSGWYTRTFQGEYIAIGFDPNTKEAVFAFAHSPEEIEQKARRLGAIYGRMYVRGIGDEKRALAHLSTPF